MALERRLGGNSDLLREPDGCGNQICRDQFGIWKLILETLEPLAKLP